jgi:type IV pilus assembly protein PilN
MGINLLPWRSARRKRQQRQFILTLGGMLGVTLLVMVVVHINIAQRIAHQEQRNQFLTSELAVMDQKIKEIQDLEKKKKNLIARMDVIQTLQSSRPEIVHLFDELARKVPEGVQLLDITQTDRTLTINGMAQSNARVSVLMRNLDISQWFGVPSLQVIESKPEGDAKRMHQTSRFALQVMQADEKKADDDPLVSSGKSKP